MLVFSIACESKRSISVQEIETAQPQKKLDIRFLDRDGKGRIDLLGVDIEPESNIKIGQNIEITYYFRSHHRVGRDLMIFLHGETPSKARVVVEDLFPDPENKRGTSQWPEGKIMMVRHFFRLPPEAEGKQIELFAGLFKDSDRLTVFGRPGQNDGKDRAKIATLSTAGYKRTLPIKQKTAGQDNLQAVIIPRTTATISADGQLNEEDWKKAPVLTFSDSLGRQVLHKYGTKLRLLYDANNLYVSFEAEDHDVSCVYQKRDDPIYNHEAVELFIMPHAQAPNIGPYFELQASPKGVIFDAAFTGRRQGMDVSYNAEQRVGTTVQGTLNQGNDKDVGYISEWIVPFAKMKWAKHPPKPGDEWRMNAFRIEKYRENGKLKGEYTAWSPPNVGDFHNVFRFGRMKFGP
ncbi:MAG: carbohydrate-binding family 9-like protein [Myxococcota bacterium]|nr:carbohydrate-binding family 9-like protein [Myxococcota bacterium]